MSGELRLLRGSAADLPSLEPFWVAVHHQHIESMPQLAPYVADTTTWAHRATLYRELLNKTGTILLLAEVAGRRVGYGLAHIHKSEDTWIADTWINRSNDRRDRIGQRLARLPQPGHRHPLARQAGARTR